MTLDEIRQFSREIRLAALEMICQSNSSHIGGALSMADLLAVLYGSELNIDPRNPNHPERDRFLLSKGHACATLYAALAIRGFFDRSQLKAYAREGSLLTSHASHHVPGVELSTGSLGHAMSVGCGLALAAKRRKKSWRTIVLLSDGELDEGSNWEGLLFAPHHGLNNLTVVVDYNKIQSLGNVKDVIQLEPLADKLHAFRWQVTEIDGHDPSAIISAFSRSSTHFPRAIIAHTVKGKGVDFMEGRLLWHYRTPSAEQLEDALKQIREKS